jgi:hypothetical protein
MVCFGLMQISALARKRSLPARRLGPPQSITLTIALCALATRAYDMRMVAMRKVAEGLFVWSELRGVDGYQSLAEELRAVKALDLARAGEGEIRHALNAFGRGYVTRTVWSVPRTSFRCRKGANPDSPWSQVSDLWAPPANLVSRGRFNQPGKPVLYFSGDPATAVMEVQPRPREFCIVLVMKKRENAPLLHFVQVGLERLPHIPAYQRALGDVIHGLREEPELAAFLEHGGVREFWKTQDEYFIELCTALYTGDDTQERYRLTNALGSQLQNIKQVHGIQYPSVANDFGGVNAAMPTNLARSALRPEEAWLVEIGDRIDPAGRGSPRHWEGVIVCRGSIDKAGRIDWNQWGRWCVQDLHLEVAPVAPLKPR